MALTSITKAYIGVGAASICSGAVFLTRDSRMWGSPVFLFLLGTYMILYGISLSITGVYQKITRRLGIGFAGAGIVLLGIWLATHPP